jgi:hypothetical protein
MFESAMIVKDRDLDRFSCAFVVQILNGASIGKTEKKEFRGTPYNVKFHSRQLS